MFKPLTHTHRLLTLTLIAASFFIYWRGTAPSVATIFDDSLEFPLVVHRLAIAHPTGYPLYTLLGKVFSWFNPSNIAYQLNLMSAVFAALAVGLAYQAGVTMGSDEPGQRASALAHHAGAAIGALIFGLGPIFYSQATIAEVYTLNACFVALALYLTLTQRWAWLAFILGLSLTHHRTMVLLLPASGLFGLVTHRRQGLQLSAKMIVRLSGLFLAPLLLYLYLPWRGQVGSLDGSYVNTWSGFWQYVLGGGYGSTFLLGNAIEQTRTLTFYGQLLQTEIGWWGLGLGGIGLGWLTIRHRWAELSLFGLALLTYLGFNLTYSVADIAVFFIPLFLLLGLLAGLALAEGLSWLAQRQISLAAGATALLLGLLLARQPDQSRADDWAVHDYGRDMLAQSLPQNAAIVGILGEMTLLNYFQETANLRPDLQTYPADREAERWQQIETLWTEQPQQAIYLTRELPGVADRWSLGAAGPLIRVHPEPLQSLPETLAGIPIPAGIDLPFNAAISLRGYVFTRPERHPPARILRLTVVWHSRASIQADYKISARLLDQIGTVVTVIDKTPVHFAYPTSTWRPDEYISDVYDLPLPADLSAGQYTPLLILYDPANNAAEIGRITLPPTYVEP